MQGQDSLRALHREVHDLFDQDNGSFPEVWVDGLSSDEAQAVYAELLRTAAPLTAQQAVWDRVTDRDVALRDLQDAGRLAAEGRLSGMHVLLTGLRWNGGDLPDLGVSVWPGAVAIDYRPGADWSPMTVGRFISLLLSLRALTRAGEIVVADEGSHPLPEERQQQFRRAVERYHASSA